MFVFNTKYTQTNYHDKNINTWEKEIQSER